MKKNLLLGMAAFLVFGFTFEAGAALYPEGYTTNSVASFWAIDGDGDNNVTISSIDYALGGGGGKIQYSYGGSGWTDFNTWPTTPLPSNSIGIATPSGKTQVFLRYLGTENAPMTYTGKLFPADLNSALYHTVVAQFGTAFSVNAAVGLSDSVSPVPLPGAVWFLGIGLVGLVGIRRRGSI